MNKRLPLTMVMLAAFALASFPATSSADDVLSVIPDNALGFLVVPKLADADGKISEVAKLLGVPVPSVMAIAKAGAGFKEGLDEQGSVAAVFLPGADGDSPPVPLLFIPTTNYEKLIKPFEPSDAEDGISAIRFPGPVTHVGKKGNFAVFVEDDQTDFLKAALKSKKGIGQNVAQLKSLVSDSDVSMVITTAGVKLGTTKFLEGIEMAKGFLAEAGPDAKAAVAGLEMYVQIFKAIQKSVTHFGLSLRIEMDGTCHLASQTILESNMQDIKVAKAAGATGKNALADLQGGPYVLAFKGVMPGGFSESMMRMSVEMIRSFPGGGEVTDKHIKKIVNTSMKAMEGVRSMSALIGIGKPGDALYSNMVMAINVDDAETYLGNYEKMMNSMRELGSELNIPFYKFDKPKRVDIDGNSALEVTMELPNVGGEAAEEMFKEMMKKMFGGDGRMRFYLAAADKNTVVGAYVKPETLSRAVKAVKNRKASLAADTELAKTTALLPAGSQWVVYINPRGAIKFVNNMGALFAPAEAGFKIPAFPKSQPIGFAAKTSLSKIETDLVVPGSVLKAIGEYAKKVRGKQEAAADF